MRLAPTAALAILGVLVLAQSRATAASSGVSDDLEELVGRAARIVEVEVVGSRAELRPDGRVETVYTFATITPMKGRVPAIHETRVPGGAVAGRGLLLPGFPVLEQGSRSVLFLSERSEPTGWRMPVGLGAGCFRVCGPAGERQVVRAAPRRDGTADVRNYDRFLAEVLAEVARQDG